MRMKKEGFTLIELLVVVLIIGILAAVALPQYTLAVRKTKFMQGIQLVRPFIEAQERYKIANGAYTYNLENLEIACPPNMTRFSIDDGAQVSVCSTQDKGISIVLATSYVKYTNSASKIIFDWFYNRNMNCIASDQTAHKLCKQFGGTLTDRDGYYTLKM